jgi:hypothetical protein
MLGADRGNFTRQTTNNTLWAGLIFVDRQGQGGPKDEYPTSRFCETCDADSSVGWAWGITESPQGTLDILYL